jgi:pantoate--beta-alanine ligase
MFVAHTEPDLARLRGSLGASDPVALVPTMGALHEGHLALVRAAAVDGSKVAASIFVNPLQFDATSDLARYPVQHEQDLAMLREAGCALAWLPTPAIMYPAEHATAIDVAGPAGGFEGAMRPGHFRGVATVVAILIGQVRPQTIWFGEKDWQQFQVVRRMIADLRLPVRARSVPTARAADGLALSSRNRFLSAGERQVAPLLHAVLQRAATRLSAGDGRLETLAESRATLTQADFEVEYLELVDGETLVGIEHPAAGARLLVAARLGAVRLLDNVGLH